MKIKSAIATLLSIFLLGCIGVKAAEKTETTPLSLPGSEPFVFRTVGETNLLLHVVKPAGWAKTDQRACMVCFFGGGWSSGTPERSIRWAKWAADLGLVGIAPDYRKINMKSRRLPYLASLNEKEKTDPSPGELLTVAVSLCESTICLTMANPRPVPPLFLTRLFSTR